MSSVSTPDLPAARGGKCLTFFVGDAEFGVAVERVQEIVGLQGVPHVSRMPLFIRGAIDRRGAAVPVVDLRERFGMAPAELGGDAPRAARARALRCVIVFEVVVPAAPGRGASRVAVGAVVDRVSDVAVIDAAAVGDVPGLGAVVRAEFLLGVAATRARVRWLLDIDRVLVPGAAVEGALAA